VSKRDTVRSVTREWFTVGKTTRDEIIAKCGEPNGRGMRADGVETLRYSSTRFTGKAYNPFYFGGDNVRKKIAVFTLDRNGVLQEFATSDESVF
jgi:hypothetical protein